MVFSLEIISPDAKQEYKSVQREKKSSASDYNMIIYDLGNIFLCHPVPNLFLRLYITIWYTSALFL
jgi:hypothetical protein